LVILECKEVFEKRNCPRLTTKLAERDPVKDDLVKLRNFAGLTLDWAAAAHGLSPCTADRSWAYTRA
jgi:hypothetical protein